MNIRWLVILLVWLLSACTTVGVQQAQAPSSHPLGYTLPPGAPNLYDNAVFARFTVFAQPSPFTIHGVQLAGWLVSCVMDEIVTSTGDPFPKNIRLVHRIGVVEDIRYRQYGRIIALVQTLINPQTQDRLILFSLDMGWVKKGEADGKWSETRGTMKPVSREGAARVMEPVHRLVAIGYVQFAKTHGLPIPTIPVVPVTTERHRHAAVR